MSYIHGLLISWVITIIIMVLLNLIKPKVKSVWRELKEEKI
jgi:hypothetical protein